MQRQLNIRPTLSSLSTFLSPVISFVDLCELEPDFSEHSEHRHRRLLLRQRRIILPSGVGHGWLFPSRSMR